MITNIVLSADIVPQRLWIPKERRPHLRGIAFVFCIKLLLAYLLTYIIMISSSKLIVHVILMTRLRPACPSIYSTHPLSLKVSSSMNLTDTA